MSIRLVLYNKDGKAYKLKGDETVNDLARRFMRCLPDGDVDYDASITLRWTQPAEPTSKCKDCGCEVAKGLQLCGECACEDDGI